MRRLVLLLALLFAAPAWADDFNVPGLEADATAYATMLAKRGPAGLTPQQKRQAEQAAAAAAQKNDMAGVVAALETRAGGGDATMQHWMALARAHLRTTPPNPVRAAQAAWEAFNMADAGAPEIPSLLLLADAFKAQNRLDYAILALEAVQERAPDNPAYTRELMEVRQQAGIQVRRVTTEPEANPPNACIEFTTAPARRADFVPGDWVRLQPAQPGAAVNREGDKVCIAGLPLGTTTRITLRAGLPGEDGLKLNNDITLNVAMANRRPRVVFDSRMFLLPRNQAATVTLTSVNLSKVKLRLLRLTERNMVTSLREYKLSEPLESYVFNSLTDNGKIVWEGTADLPRWQPNQTLRTALPLPDAFAEPGAYLLQATPGDGTPDSGASAIQVVIRTDLAPTVWRGTDGLTVQVRSYADASVRPGVRLRLLARSNDVLAEATTDADGVARFAAPLMRGTGPQAPQSIHGISGDDLVALDLTAAAFDLSDRGVEGAPSPGPLDAFAWTDRGIYRPGETVQVMALLRDAAGAPQDIPAHVRVKRPNGQVFTDVVPLRGPDASLHLAVPISLSAPAGEWTVEVLGDPKADPIGTASFRVDAFVPERMAVDVAPSGPIVSGKPYQVPVTARFLYGAPAANLSGSATLKLVPDPSPPASLAGYTIGLDGEQFAPDTMQLALPDTDSQGHSTLPILLKSAPDTTRPVRAELEVSVDDPSGRSSLAHASIKVRPTGNLLGIKPLFPGHAIDAGGEAAFELAAADPDGTRVAIPARLRLVRERPDWRLVRHGELSRFETVYRDEPIETQDIQLGTGAPARYAKRLDFGRYRLEIAERDGLAATSVRFRAGWVASDSPDTPDKVDVSTDRKMYKPGEVAKLHILSPFAGQATVLTLTDRVQSIRDVTVEAGGADVEMPVDAAWGPGAYATVHVFRGGGGPARPARAIGLAWVGIDPAERTLPVAVDAPDKVPPRGRVVVPVRTAPGAWITMAAVDEGVLRLTSFQTPDPAAHFLGRRTLGIDIRDDWGRLIAPGDGDATVLKQGGDAAAMALPEIPQKVVALFTPPVQAGADGVAQVPLDLPDFNGQVRLMVVAWQGTKVGAAGQDMLVRDPMIAEPLLPRFLAPGDEARLAVVMQNLDLPPGEGAADVSVDGPLQVAGETHLAATLPRDAQVLRTTTLRATGVGRGVIHLAVHGPGGFEVQREVAILVRPARPPVTVGTSSELAARAEAPVQPALASMVAGTGVARATFGGPMRYDVPGILQALRDYPLFCLEQTTSHGLPLALFPDGSIPGEDRAAELQTTVSSVLDRQRYDGGFGLWTSSNEAEPWLSAYATEFLWRARAAGASVPDGAMRDAVKFLADSVDNETSEPAELAARAYQLYALALTGQARAGANRVLAEDLGKLPTPLARAQVAAALALSNDRPRAETAFVAALDSPARRDWYADRGSALRDQLAITVLLRDSGLLPDRLRTLIGTLPGADLKPASMSTQEEAWAAAAAAVLGRDGRPVHVALDGRDLPPAPSVAVPLTGPATVRNLDDRAVWQTVSTTGVPTTPAPAARNQMRVSREFYTLAGQPLDLEGLKQNTVFVLLMEGRADDRQDHNAMLLQGLPAGWEIAGRIKADDNGAAAGMQWLGVLTPPEAQPAADDRFAATFLLTPDKPAFRIAVRLRAVTPGSYEMPGALLSDMYRPTIFARQATARIKVLAPE